MIGKTIKGEDTRGLLRYLLSSEKIEKEDARMLGGTIAGRTVDEISAEFEAIQLLRPKLKKAVYHQMLRPPPGEGENLSDAIWLGIAAFHANEMGYRDGQWLAVRHRDHIHIIANRVLVDGNVVRDSHDWRRAEISVRKIEKQFSLTQVESSHLLEPEKSASHVRAFSQAEIALADKGEVSARAVIQEAVIAVLDRPQSLTDFCDQLYELGVFVRPNAQSTGRLAGLSFFLPEFPEIEFSGSSLGRKFSLSNLKKQGLTYDVTRDRQGVGRCLERCAVRGSSSEDGAIPDGPERRNLRLGDDRRAASRGDHIDDRRSRDRGGEAAGNDQERRDSHPGAERGDRQVGGGARSDGQGPGAAGPRACGTDSFPAAPLAGRSHDERDRATDGSSLDRVLDLAGWTSDLKSEHGDDRVRPTDPATLPSDVAGATAGVQRAPRQYYRPIADPGAAKRHLDAVGAPVVLAVRYPSGRVRQLGVVDSRTFRRWMRRLHRRSTLGQEILIRPTKDSLVLLLPRQPVMTAEMSARADIRPFLTVTTEWNRQDLWVRLAGDDREADAVKLGAGLIEAGVGFKRFDDAPWGHLAGYRPDPMAAKRTAGRLLTNRIVEAVDAVVEMSRELLERLRKSAAPRRKVAVQSQRAGTITAARDEGRSR